MNRLEDAPELTCSAVRELLHKRLDSLPTDDASCAQMARLDAHLQACPACHELDEGWRHVREAIRALPRLEFPQAALARVWRATELDTRSVGSPWRIRTAVGVAALLGLFAVGLGWVLPALVGRDHTTSPTPGDARTPAQPASEPAYTAIEIEQATEQTRVVLGVTGRALRRVESATLDCIWADTLAPAVRRIRVRLPFISSQP